jgi:cell division FtsZ-interacting protein ZapD
MMGNLSPVSHLSAFLRLCALCATTQQKTFITKLLKYFQGLKNHAVTMFEVGKLSDESLDSLLLELEKVQSKVHLGIKD